MYRGLFCLKSGRGLRQRLCGPRRFGGGSLSLLEAPVELGPLGLEALGQGFGLRTLGLLLGALRGDLR